MIVLTGLCVGFFQALANPTRLAILEALIDKPMTATGISKYLDIDFSHVHHFLKILVKCNIVLKDEKKIYHINPDTALLLQELNNNHMTTYCEDANCWKKTES